MAVCVRINPDASLTAYNPTDGCGDYLLVTQSEVNGFNFINQPFQINHDLFIEINGYILLTFIAGHSLGRILKAFGKH